MFLTGSLLTAQADTTTIQPMSTRTTEPQAQTKLEVMKTTAQVNYLASPHEITSMGLRSQWQITIPSGEHSSVAGMSLDGTEIFAWDH
ncbi:MAG: hypothetical protein EBS66_19700, partial [Betaproteobacteria bacterium]|nr:hypothetical protein [Betaproteobacteria bacterium]